MPIVPDSVLEKNGLDTLVILTNGKNKDLDYVTNQAGLNFGIYIQKKGEEPTLVFHTPEEKKAFKTGVENLVSYDSLSKKLEGKIPFKELLAKNNDNKILTYREKNALILKDLGVEGKVFFIGSSAGNNFFHNLIFLKNYLNFDLVDSSTNDKPITPISDSRVVKNDWEIMQLKKSGEATKNVFEGIKNYLSNNSEIVANDLKAFIKYEFLKNNCTLEEITVSDGSSERGYHGDFEDGYVIKKPASLLIDIAPKNDRNYYCDTSRTFHLGKPTEDFVKVYNDVLDVKNNLADYISNNFENGVMSADVDALAREWLLEKGYPVYLKGVDDLAEENQGIADTGFNHSIGHGIGLNAHENPHFFRFEKGIAYRHLNDLNTKLEDRNVFTIEPGIYLPGFGVRIEDTYAVIDGKLVSMCDYPTDLESMVIPSS